MITKEQKEKFLEFANECRLNHIPVVREKTAEMLCGLVRDKRPKNILEIGTAVGYSGTLMLLSCLSSQLTTLEISEQMCKKAKNNFIQNGVCNRVNIVNKDALDYLKDCNKTFDFIFLDGPKGQYIKYLPFLKKVLVSGGTLFCDDVLYFGMVENDNLVVHKKITIVRNLREFIKQVKEDPVWKSDIKDIEDGVLIAEKL